jgi:hypothetical protein
VLSSHGKRLKIGSFLTPDERFELAEALTGALSKQRAPDHIRDSAEVDEAIRLTGHFSPRPVACIEQISGGTRLSACLIWRHASHFVPYRYALRRSSGRLA